MVATGTLVLSAIVIAGVIMVLGTETTAAAATSAGSGAKRAAKSSWTFGIAGAGLGMEIGNMILQFVMTEPFGVTTLLATIGGALGIEGMLDLSGIQFALVGAFAFLLVLKYKEWRGA